MPSAHKHSQKSSKLEKHAEIIVYAKESSFVTLGKSTSPLSFHTKIIITFYVREV